MAFPRLESLHKVISSALNISVKTTGLPCNRAQQLASDFLTKNTMVSLTIWNIINPKNTKEFPVVKSSFKAYDFSSANVLVRTLFEGYINMNYVLIDSVSDEEKEFRMNLWDRHGLLERQKMGTSIGSRPKQFQIDKRQINIYTKSITNSQYFKNLPKSEQQSFLNMDKWTKLKTLERADRANIHRSQSEFIFKFLSNYAHSESYALMQIYSVRSTQTAQELMRLPMGFTEMFLSLTLKLLAKLQPVAMSTMEGDRELLDIIESWEDMKTKDLKKSSTKNRNQNPI